MFCGKGSEGMTSIFVKFINLQTQRKYNASVGGRTDTYWVLEVGKNHLSKAAGIIYLLLNHPLSHIIKFNILTIVL